MDFTLFKKTKYIYFHGGFASQGHVQDCRCVFSVFFLFANPSLVGKVFLDVLDGKAMDSDSSLLEECRFCKRKFRFDRIAKHETRCPESKAGLETTGRYWEQLTKVVLVCVGGVLFIFTILKK